MEDNGKTTIFLNDIGNICRVCLATNQNTRCIFRTEQNDPNSTDDTYDLPGKLRLCGGVKIVEDDGLPATICTRCLTKVNDAHELRKQCQRADVKLRKLYGKYESGNKSDTPIGIVHRHCQTDDIFVDSDVGQKANDHLLLNVNSSYNSTCTDESKSNNEINYDDTMYMSNAHPDKQCVYTKCRQAEYEKISTGREAYRTRRMTTFKRVTSMERLKSHKERQRQYIKKNVNLKREAVESDCTANVKNSANQMESKSDSRCTYVCPKCDRCYFSKKSLDRHVSTHKDKEVTCNKCDKVFFQSDEFQRHTKLHKGKEKLKPVLCKICNKNFRKMDTMVRHLNVHKKANPKEVLSVLKEIRDKRRLENIVEHRESILGSSTNDDDDTTARTLTTIEETKSNEDNLEERDTKFDRTLPKDCLSNSDSNSRNDIKVERFDDAQLYRCEYCAKCYTTEKSLQRHLSMHEEKKFVCTVCNMKFFRQDRLESHKSRYGHDEDKGPSEIQKPSDDKSAIRLINSWIREELDSDNEEKGFPCKICGKSYDTKKSLSKHQTNAHDAEKGRCTNCCSESCTCTARDRDRRKVDERSKPYRCDECDKSFEKEVKLQRHVRIHERAKEQQDSNFKRFLCHICSKTFRQNTGLMFHMRTHTGYKPHVCKYCGRGFTSNSNCINHERTHTGDRPFVCHFCSAAFAKSCTLKAHITTHTGEANYHCKTCGKSFRRLKYLKEHRFTHTGEKPYACKICGTAYSHSGSLFVHEKKCKAQYNSYQTSSAQTVQAYCQPQISSPTVTPIITVLSQAHPNDITGAGALGAQTNKSYMDTVQVQRTNSQSVSNVATSVLTTDLLHVHSNHDISVVRNFALIGQMFQS